MLRSLHTGLKLQYSHFCVKGTQHKTCDVHLCLTCFWRGQKVRLNPPPRNITSGCDGSDLTSVHVFLIPKEYPRKTETHNPAATVIMLSYRCQTAAPFPSNLPLLWAQISRRLNRKSKNSPKHQSFFALEHISDVSFNQNGSKNHINLK